VRVFMTDAPVAYDYSFTVSVEAPRPDVQGRTCRVVSIPDGDADYQTDRYRSDGFCFVQELFGVSGPDVSCPDCGDPDGPCDRCKCCGRRICGPGCAV